MKSITKYILLLFIPLSMIGCQKNDFVADEVNHSMISTSFGSSSPILQVNGTMSFVDVSRGVVSREWIFPDGVVTDTLGNPMTSSTSSNQKVKFIVPGEYYVKAKQVFEGDVYVTDGFIGDNTYEKDIQVIVYDSVRASYTAAKLDDAQPLDIANGAENEITAGSIVRFTVTSTGNPATNTFSVFNADGEVATGSASTNSETGELCADIQLAMPGVYSVKLTSSNDFGISSVTYTDLVNVVASMEPIYLNSISRISTSPGNVISLEFSRGMVVQDGFSTDAFTLDVTNGTRTIDVAVTEVSTSSNYVNLTLSETIYSSDVVLLSYDNSLGKLAAIDNPETLQESFTSVGVTFPVSDLLSTVGYDAGFENGTGTWAYLWWGGQWGKYASEVSTAQAYSGSKSFKIEMSNREGFGYVTAANTNSGAVMSNAAETFPVEAGKVYVLGVWTYVESLQSDLGTDAADFLFTIKEEQTYDNQMPFGADTPIGEWVYRTQQIPVSTTTGDVTLFIRGNNVDFAESFIIYLDDLTLSEAEERP